ncbi:MAG: hypothetical protein KAQ85_00805 [Thermodesulfovibrionia bacterium]|nr:hypothetical protein [Thermodesulfovibrionia bacterium]
METNKPIRKVRVLRQIEVSWANLKKGDIFRTLKIDDEDIHADEEVWNLAIEDVKETNDPETFRILSECILDNIQNFAPSVIKEV